ncbi:hypothetical protein PoB_004606000 [Plakobranchus ocellatus]|uniref:Uncharacterized protein n=1 Tax=Plakobranchus ocellatus TaxID=259542 RepID=A0AAV4BG73_9GAST|nr:hypothetical protein PoB_004606000 [Plakobranchus ocellatus]
MLCEDPPSRHAIELSTLKYMESAPVDRTLLAHRLPPPPPPQPGRTSTRNTPRDSSNTRVPGDQFAQLSDCSLSLSFTGRRSNEANSCSTQETTLGDSSSSLSLNHFSLQQQEQQQQHQRQQEPQQQQHQKQQQKHRQQSNIPSISQHNFLSPSGESGVGPPIRRLSCVSAVTVTHPPPQYQPHPQQQPPHQHPSGGVAGSGSSCSHPPPPAPRRLPDYVTVDQCYSASAAGDQDCSTVCLIANFDVGGRGLSGVGTGGGGLTINSVNNNCSNIYNNNAIANNYLSQAYQPPQRRGTVSIGTTQHHHQQLQQQHQVDSGNSSGSGGTARKERTSLRRGIMMRQLSLNPSHERDIHLVAGKVHIGLC